MPIDFKVVVAYVFGIIILFFLARLLLNPMKVITKLFYNAIIGGIVLFLVNFVGGMFDFHIAFNVLSALITGTLGVPGVLLLVVLKIIFKV